MLRIIQKIISRLLEGENSKEQTALLIYIITIHEYES